MEKSTTFSESIKHYSLPLVTKILCPRIHFRARTTDIDNKYDFCYRTCAEVSSMLEVVEFIVSYPPVAVIRHLCTIISIASTEGLIIFVSDIFNYSQNTIIHNPE